jgi:glycosidase
MGVEGRKGIGSPYAVADYSEVDPEFGTKAEWFDLVRSAHGLGMKVLLGFMPNHTARDHVWLSENPGFHLRDEQGNPAFDFDWSDTAKLDYTNPALRRKVTDTLLYWLRGEDEESGVDGYRMDMAHMINDLGFWNECIPELEAAGTRPLILLAECYGFERNLDLFHRGFHSAYDDDFYKIAQYGYVRDTRGNSRLLLDPAAETNADFSPRLTAWRERGIAGAVESLMKDHMDRAPELLLARYVDNHDEGRGVHRFGRDACRVLMDLAACLPGSIVFTLAGQEAGALNRPPIHEYFDVCDKGYRRLSADGTVTAIEGIEFEGNQFFRTSEERAQAVSEMRNRFRLHRDHPALRSGGWQPYDVGEKTELSNRTVVAFRRSSPEETLVCLFNLGHDDRVLNQVPSGTLIHGTDQGNILPAFSSRVVSIPI